MAALVSGACLHSLYGKAPALEVSQDIPAASIETTSSTNSLELTSSTDNAQYVKNDEAVFWTALNRASDANPATLRILKGNLTPSMYSTPGHEYIVYVYATDGERVYHTGSQVWGADAATFEPIENGRAIHTYGKDKGSVFYEARKIQGADPASFTILWSMPPEGCPPPHYSRDANHVFFRYALVEGANPHTFEILRDGYGKDKDHVYKGEVLQEGISPVGFVAPVTCQYG